MTQSVQDEVVVITGASSGLGAETARHLTAAGAVMVDNAGLMPLSPLERERFDGWEQAIDVNVKGVLLFAIGQPGDVDVNEIRFRPTRQVR